MSNLPIKDANDVTRKVDVFTRTEGPDTVETQAVVAVDPATGTPIDFATQTTVAALLVAAQAIQSAAAALNAKTTAVNTGAIAGTVAVSNMVSQGLTDTQLRASAVPVSIASVPTHGVTGTFWQATQPVSGPLTDAQLRENAVPVSAASLGEPASAVATDDTGTWSLIALVKRALGFWSSLASAVGLHNAPFADGSPGIILLGKRRDSDSTLVADGDLNTLNMDETGRLKVSSQPASYADTSGSITASGQTVFANVDRASNVTISMVATTLVGHNATFEYSNNSTNGADGNWYGVQVARSNANTTDTATGVLAATPAYGWEVSVNAYRWIRIRATAHTSGTASYLIKQGTYATEPVPIIQVTGTQPVSFTQPALVAGTARAAFVAGAAIWFDDSSTVLAGAATFTGTSRDLTVTATAVAMANAATYAKEVRVSAETDQSGTLWVEFSRDNTNWRRAKAAPTAAVTGGAQFAEIVFRPSWRYMRVGFTNGATLQTRFSLGSILIAN